MEDFEDEIVIGEGVKVNAGAASLPMRMASALIDAGVTLVLLVGSSWALTPVFMRIGDAWFQTVSILWVVTILVAVPTTVETITRGRSLGKLALGLRVVRDDGGPVSVRQAAARALVGVLELYGSVGILAITTALLSSRGKRIGDYLAGTYALRARTLQQPLPPVHVPVPLREWAAASDIARLPDGTALTARLFLARAAQMNPSSRATIGQRLADRLAEHVAPPPPAGTHPESFIAAVLATRRDREYVILRGQADAADRELALMTRLPYGVPDAND